MKSNLTLTKKDIVVVLFCAFFLLMNLGAVGARGNEHAKRVLCASNLKQLNIILGFFLGDNDGKFPDADWNDDGRNDPHGQWWIQSLKQYMEEDTKILICPKAKRHPENPPGDRYPDFTIGDSPLKADECWGSRDKTPSPTAGEWTWGSYAPNGWIMDQKEGTWGSPWGDPSAYWGKIDGIPNPSRVPIFLDCRWVDAWPHHTDIPDSEPYVFNGEGYMRCFTILRHGKAVNSVFADGSVSRVAIKDLWKLKWHKGFDTSNQYADEANLPGWMR